MAYKDIRTNKDEKKKAQTLVAELKEKVSGLERANAEKEKSLKDGLDAERARADSAENALEGLKREMEELKRSNAENEAAAIARFKKSPEYDQAMANAGAPEVLRCWLVAERHIKTDPYASWDTFIDNFVAAKKAVEDGEGEPEPFDGPSPSFIPAPPLNDPDQL